MTMKEDILREYNVKRVEAAICLHPTGFLGRTPDGDEHCLDCGEFQNDIDRYLDEHPCQHCGKHYYAHDYLTQDDIDDAREQGCTVDICETHTDRVLVQGDTFFCVVTPLPKNPCDEVFMKEIST